MKRVLFVLWLLFINCTKKNEANKTSPTDTGFERRFDARNAFFYDVDIQKVEPQNIDIIKIKDPYITQNYKKLLSLANIFNDLKVEFTILKKRDPNTISLNILEEWKNGKTFFFTFNNVKFYFYFECLSGDVNSINSDKVNLFSKDFFKKPF